MTKVQIGIIVDNINSSKQIFDFIKMSLNSDNYEVTHLIIQKNHNEGFIKKFINFIKKKRY